MCCAWRCVIERINFSARSPDRQMKYRSASTRLNGARRTLRSHAVPSPFASGRSDTGVGWFWVENCGTSAANATRRTTSDQLHKLSGSPKLRRDSEKNSGPRAWRRCCSGSIVNAGGSGTPTTASSCALCFPTFPDSRTTTNVTGRHEGCCAEQFRHWRGSRHPGSTTCESPTPPRCPAGCLVKR